VRILNEPTAAALAYGAGSSAEETMLVYDLGGGTFDVSVVVVESGVVEVKASHGDTHLGGDDFDQMLVEHAVAEFKRQHGADLKQDPKTLRRLKVAMEHAKCRLSDEAFVHIREEYLDGKHHLELEITRHQYESMIQHFLEKTLHCLHQSMTDAKLSPRDINKVMLVGGATRTPLVQRLLQERMQLDPRFEINPDLIVAMGAAVQAGIIAGEKRHSILVDITPHSFSTATLAEREGSERLVCVPPIARNTPLPASRSDLFCTLYDTQKEVKVTAYQGESPLPEGNVLIGDFVVEGLSKVPAGNPIVIHFALDLNGMLKVTATEKATGLAKTVTMDTRGKGGLDVAEARRNIASLVGDPEAADPSQSASGETAAAGNPESLLATARDLRKRGEALLEKNINAQDATEIRDLIHQGAEAIARRDWTALAKQVNALSDLLFYMED